MPIKGGPPLPQRQEESRLMNLKVHEKTVRTAIKQDLIPDLNPLYYAIWGVLENKTNTTSHPNIGSVTQWPRDFGSCL